MSEKSAYDKLWDDCMRYSYFIFYLKKEKEQLIEEKFVLEKKISDLEKSLKETNQNLFTDQVHTLKDSFWIGSWKQNAETTDFWIKVESWYFDIWFW